MRESKHVVPGVDNLLPIYFYIEYGVVSFQRNTYLLFILFFAFFMGRRSVNTEKYTILVVYV